MWTLEAIFAFQKLKETMASTPILQLLDFTQPFEVQTGASGFGVGAMLTQKRHPLALFSKKTLSPATFLINLC